MNKSLLLVLLLLSLPSVTSSTPAVEDGVMRYKGYDELVTNITSLGYNNRTYFMADYSRRFTYSGSVILDEAGDGVRDNNTILIFSMAKIIHKNYGQENIKQFRDFSRYFASMERYPALDSCNDSGEIAELFSTSAMYLEKCVGSFSPDDTLQYLSYESKLMEKMRRSYNDSLNMESNETALRNYQDSLETILVSMINNREHLIESGKIISRETESRINSRENESSINPLLIASTFLVLIFLFLLKR